MLKIIILLVAFFLSSLSYAFDLAAGLTPPSQQKVMLNYVGLFHNNASFASGDAATSYQRMSLNGPVYKTDTEAFGVSVAGSQFSVKPSQANFSELYDIQFGVSYTKALDEKRMWSMALRYGSASDKPFATNDVTTLGATAFYSYPSDETSRWLLLVDYSNNRPILNGIPLPGFAYFYTPSKNFRGVFGAPFVSINWNFAEEWSLDAFTLVPWVFKASVGYKVTPFAKIYTGFDFSQVTYYLKDRTNEKDRLFYDEKKIFIGAKSPLSKSIFADLELGHAFDRAFFIAENYKTSPDNPVDIGNAYYGKLSLNFIF